MAPLWSRGAVLPIWHGGQDMPHIVETNIVCKECGGTHLQWERINNIFFWDWRVLRCRRCLDAVRVRVPTSTWILYAIALAAVVWASWSVGQR